jgi:ActR/RegA family two-component response regulator
LNQRVLVIEDDPILRRAMQVLIGAAGAQVLLAESVTGAIASLAAAPPSHVLLDLKLSDGCGLEVLRHIRDNNLPIRVAIVSGSSDRPPRPQMKALTPDATFRKPADWDAVLRWLATT